MLKNIKRKDAAIKKLHRGYSLFVFLGYGISQNCPQVIQPPSFLSCQNYFTVSRLLTGIEIHPGAKIGKDVFIATVWEL